MKFLFLRRRLPLFLLLVSSTFLASGCLRTQNSQVELKVGFTHQDVTGLLGQPDEVGEFVVPDGPFFGPQEALSGLVPAESTVEEWRYSVNDEVTYVWFYGDSNVGKDAWRLIATATVPEDAVY